ncbi:MAG: primosomal protein N' [Nitrospina sp.]|nr:primosomal protein N' [Nitrospina sp.]MBT4558546.1 primosomal protein N' [Nitrospina sp.]MBT5349349.1 primosomal protein N' [Nitrospina sp.]MBT5653267.1 primosomal protein N' [Nitrospina sp.]MBT6248531.1 primosomal protein N' [Nitrospina sp.]
MNSQTQLKIEPFDAIPSTEKPYAEVVFNLPLRDPFTYIIPPKLLGKVRVGMRVLVPFGRRRITGYVVNLVEKWDKPIALKTIAELPDLEPIVSEEILSLTRWLADYYQSAWGEAISSALPAGLDKTSYQLVKAVRLASNLPTEEEITDLLKRSPKQKSVFDLVRQKEINLAELETLIPGGKSALRSLKEKKLVEVFTEKKERQALVPEGTMDQPFGSHLTFTPEQEAVFNEISSTIDAGKFQSFLLHGITGSGKTEVYIRCIQRILEMDKTAIMMVPEISLTPQTVKRFRQRFGDRVAILHSGLSQTERYLEWKKIYEEKVSIAVGARSAVFAPFKNLGIIVIDEEHDGSYKQDSNPRYHARDTAVMRARSANAVVLMGSATPSMESVHNTQLKKYKYLSLKSRIGESMLPIVSMVDMKRERKEFKNFAMLSGVLRSAIRDRLSRNEQIFLFLNRRGTARFVFCPDCGYVLECAHCSVTLTFHGTEDRLLCHYCNFKARMPNHCVECHGEVIRFSGFGTQKMEEEVNKLFPHARTTRIDRDTTRGRDSFAAMHRDMNAGNIDILIGTQMITKGHDFPNVTLVGVIHADLALNIPDFRSCERAFQLLTQVAGRAGRGKVPGKVIIQTNNPDHYMFEFVQEHDVNAFHEKELKLRRQLNYPPFTRLVAIELVSDNESLVKSTSEKLGRALTRQATRNKGVEILGPSKAALYQIQNKFRWHVILRGQKMQALQGILADSRELQELKSASSGKLKISVDVDPFNLQ